MITLAYAATLIVVILIFAGVICLYCAIKQRDRQIRNLINDVCVYKALYEEDSIKLKHYQGIYASHQKGKGGGFFINCAKCGKFVSTDKSIAVIISPWKWEHYHPDCFPIKYNK